MRFPTPIWINGIPTGPRNTGRWPWLVRAKKCSCAQRRKALSDMKPPYIIITQNGSSAKYRLNPEYDGLANIRTRLFEYSVTNDAKTLPNGLFVLISLPIDIKTKIGRAYRSGKDIHIDLFLDENWKFSIDMCTND